MQNTQYVHFPDLMSKQNTEALLISSVPNIIYLTGYAGFSSLEREAYLLITRNNQYIFTDGRYVTAVKREISNFTLLEIKGEKTFVRLLRDVCRKEKLEIIGFEAENLSVSEYVKIKKVVKKMKAVSLRNIRVTKNPDEIKKIKKACDLAVLMYQYITTKIKVGVTEKEIAVQMEIFIKQKGAELSFPTIVAFGGNAAVPHHLTSDKRLTTNNWVLIDFGVKYKNYSSDMTRTMFFGKATAEQKKMYQTVLKSQQEAVKFLNQEFRSKNYGKKTKSSNRPLYHKLTYDTHKIKASDVDKVARDYIISQGYPTIPHSVGHGIGIEIHEAPTLSPNSKDILEEGRVFSIEPGIYIPNVGGVRIEDLFVIQKNQLVQLTNNSSSKTI